MATAYVEAHNDSRVLSDIGDYYVATGGKSPANGGQVTLSWDTAGSLTKDELVGAAQRAVDKLIEYLSTTTAT